MTTYLAVQDMRGRFAALQWMPERLDSRESTRSPCGRELDPEDPGTHSYPANVPPHFGRHRGPRAGDTCPNNSDFNNQVILGHKFNSEVILLAVDLPPSLDAPLTEPSGKAIIKGTRMAHSKNVFLNQRPRSPIMSPWSEV